MEDMATVEDVKSKWYMALFEEDSIQVMKLLDAHSNLLKVGWKSEPSREVGGRTREEYRGWTRSTWKGRIALHVGVSRGCTKLVMQVMRSCNFDDFSKIDEAYQKSLSLLEEFSFSKRHPDVMCNECKVSPTVGNRWKSTVKDSYELCPDCYEKFGNEEEFIKIEYPDATDPLAGRAREQGTEKNLGKEKELIEIEYPDATDPLAGRAREQVAETRGLASVVPQQKGSGVTLSDEDVRTLLYAKDGERGLDAFAISAFGNQEVLILIRFFFERVTSSKLSISRTIEDLTRVLTLNADKRKLLRQITCRVDGIDSFTSRLYSKHRDFNFLPREEYMFHFMVVLDQHFHRPSQAKGPGQNLWRQLWRAEGPARTLWRAIRSSEEGELWRFVVELKDAQGRPPFHVAMVESSHWKRMFFRLSTIRKDGSSATTGEDKDVIVSTLTAPDAAGRTPVYRAAALGNLNSLQILLHYATQYEEIAATCHAAWAASGDIGLMSEQSIDTGFRLKYQCPCTPLHAAIIHGHFDCAEVLIQKGQELGWPKPDMTYRFTDELISDILGNDTIVPMTYGFRPDWIDWVQSMALIELDIIELACLVGAPMKLILLLMNTFMVDLHTPRKPLYIRKSGDEEHMELVTLKHLWHPLHLVSTSGKYDLVKYFIHDLKCNPYVEDCEGNSALHHAMKVRVIKLKMHLMDCVDQDHVQLSKQNALRVTILDDKSVTELQGCINLLLRVGCDLFKKNKEGQLPYPTGNLNDVKFLPWWYGRQQEEFKTAQNNLNFTTNAIAVTAALVATASYVGPLQPPMGYDGSQIQYENVWVSIFIVCDTLSFYLAIVAIIFSLIPSLPMPQQPMLEELQRTRGMVIWAVRILLPSLFFVFVAFASGSISVMSANITSEAGGILTIVSTLTGIVFCVVAFTLFAVRLLAFIYPEITSIRKLYDASNYFTTFAVQ